MYLLKCSILLLKNMKLLAGFGVIRGDSWHQDEKDWDFEEYFDTLCLKAINSSVYLAIKH